jgi:peptidyl-prolyl cis-trans isomerase SurA
MSMAVKKRMKSRLLACLCGLLSGVLFLGALPALADDAVDRIVAVVNGDIVTQFELDEVMRPILDRFKGHAFTEDELMQLAGVKRKMLDRLINETLLKQEVERMKIAVSDAELENQLRQIKAASNLDDEQLNQKLAGEKITRKEFERKIKDDLLRQRLIGMMVRRKVLVVPEDVEKRAKELGKGLNAESRAEISLIVLGLDKDAEGLRKRILAGELTFEDAATQYSVGPGSDQGGSLGAMALKDMQPGLRQIVLGLSPGDISKPFENQNYQVLLKLTSLAKGEGRANVEGEEQIRDELYKAKMEELFSDYMEKLRSKAVIEVRL